MNFYLAAALCAVGGYLVGGIPFALLVGKTKGIDIRRVGSGNVGAMNVGRALGRKWFVAVFTLDLLKGLLSTVIAGQVLFGAISAGSPGGAVRDLCWLGAGLCAVLGHNYPPFLAFRGGKGVSTSLGVALGIYPDLTLPAVLCFVLWSIGIGVTRMSSVGSILGGVMFPVLYCVLPSRGNLRLPERWPFVAFTVVTAVLVVVRHRANIARIVAGKEARVGRSRSGNASPPSSS